MKPCLILFDIDGTMLDTGGVGIEAFEQGFARAFPEAYEATPFPKLELGGATDGGLVNLLFDHFEISWSQESQDRFYHHYLALLDVALQKSYQDKTGRQLPGITGMIDALTASPHHIGLLTGNLEKGAMMKLRHFDYPEALFGIGAYGDDHHDRNKLGPIAIGRAEAALEREFVPEEEVFILGDTLKDIACARACGAKVIAVATGAHDYDKLEAAEPDFLFRDFSDHQSVLKSTGLI